MRRAQSFRRRPANDVSPVGGWQLQIARYGVIAFAGPRRSRSTDAFTATPAGTLTLQGPANWLLPAGRQASLCDVEGIGAYSWATRADDLVLTRDLCPDRDSVLAGIWKRT